MRDDWQCDSSLTRFEVAQSCRPGGATANSPGFQPREISFKTYASGYQFALTHGLIKKHQRNFVSLLTALSFVVLAVTGILAFMRPFSIGVAGVCYRLLIEIDQADDDQPPLVCLSNSTTLNLERFKCWIWSGSRSAKRMIKTARKHGRSTSWTSVSVRGSG